MFPSLLERSLLPCLCPWPLLLHWSRTKTRDLVLFCRTICILFSYRYFKFMIQVDHPSTFSVKNLNMIIVGIFVLIILVATGPLYGLGEYSYYRGIITHLRWLIDWIGFYVVSAIFRPINSCDYQLWKSSSELNRNSFVCQRDCYTWHEARFNPTEIKINIYVNSTHD